MEYIYFVSYIHNEGYGNAEVGYKKEIDSLDDIMAIQEYIKDKNEFSNVLILNYILLNVNAIEGE